MAVEWRVKNTNTFTEPVGGDKIHGMLAELERYLAIITRRVGEADQQRVW